MKTSVYIEVIRQLTDLLKQLSPNEYTKSLCVLNGSSIGQHTRHVVEFYQCLLAGKSGGVVDYDGRERNLLLENDLNFTIESLEKIENNIISIKNPNETILLTVSYCADNQDYIETNFMREMVYLVEHSIHHYALIRIGLQQNFPDINIPKNFGIAYSTIRHHEMSA
jgi:tRNA isopentenyl-2-thiomethyl-A-37 hydroxylase MiaE